LQLVTTPCIENGYTEVDEFDLFIDKFMVSMGDNIYRYGSSSSPINYRITNSKPSIFFNDISVLNNFTDNISIKYSTLSSTNDPITIKIQGEEGDILVEDCIDNSHLSLNPEASPLREGIWIVPKDLKNGNYKIVAYLKDVPTVKSEIEMIVRNNDPSTNPTPSSPSPTPFCLICPPPKPNNIDVNIPLSTNNCNSDSLEISDNIFSTNENTNLIISIKSNSDWKLSLSGTTWSTNGSRNTELNINSTDLGQNLSDNTYKFILESCNSSKELPVSIDNTPPVVEIKNAYFSSGEVKITAEIYDPIVNGISSGLDNSSIPPSINGEKGSVLLSYTSNGNDQPFTQNKGTMTADIPRKFSVADERLDRIIDDAKNTFLIALDPIDKSKNRRVPKLSDPIKDNRNKGNLLDKKCDLYVDINHGKGLNQGNVRPDKSFNLVGLFDNDPSGKKVTLVLIDGYQQTSPGLRYQDYQFTSQYNLYSSGGNTYFGTSYSDYVKGVSGDSFKELFGNKDGSYIWPRNINVFDSLNNKKPFDIGTGYSESDIKLDTASIIFKSNKIPNAKAKELLGLSLINETDLIDKNIYMVSVDLNNVKITNDKSFVRLFLGDGATRRQVVDGVDNFGNKKYTEAYRGEIINSETGIELHLINNKWSYASCY
jgi:hypothetical protein